MAFFPILYYFAMLFQEDWRFESAQPFTFHLKNCEIIYVRNNEYSPESPYF